jgi:hypothetical protein
MSNLNIMFGTPLWVYDLSSLIDNNALEQEGTSFTGGNYFDLTTKNITLLKNKMREICDDISVQYNWKNKPTGIYGTQRPLFPNELDTPHYHYGQKLVAVYYIKAEPKCGDIIFHDPRGGTDWEDINARTEDNGKTQRTYHRVTPVPGMLVLFPNYLIHSVEPNFSNTLRLSIAISIYE